MLHTAGVARNEGREVKLCQQLKAKIVTTENELAAVRANKAMVSSGSYHGGRLGRGGWAATGSGGGRGGGAGSSGSSSGGKKNIF